SGHRRLGSASRSIGVADVGASGSSVQLLPSRFQVPVHSTKTGWDFGRLSMEQMAEWTSGTWREIVVALRERIRTAVSRRRARMEEHVGRYWISWRRRNRDRVFAEVRALRGRVE